MLECQLGGGGPQFTGAALQRDISHTAEGHLWAQRYNG